MVALVPHRTTLYEGYHVVDALGWRCPSLLHAAAVDRIQRTVCAFSTDRVLHSKGFAVRRPPTCIASLLGSATCPLIRVPGMLYAAAFLDKDGTTGLETRAHLRFHQDAFELCRDGLNPGSILLCAYRRTELSR